MPLYRKLHVKTLDSLDINDMPDDFTRYMWLILPLKLDREGRAIDDLQWLRSVLFPLRHELPLSKIDDAMRWYHERGMIDRYQVGSRRYFFVVNFARYQGNTAKEAPSLIPVPPAKQANNSSKLLQSKSGVSQELVQTYSSADAGIDADADADARAERPASPPAPPDEKDQPEKSKTEPDTNPLEIALTPGGQLLLAKYDAYQLSKGRKNTLKCYTNAFQCAAFTKTYVQLGSELGTLIEKGLARDRAPLEKMLSWLEGCARNENGANHAGNQRPAARQPVNQPAGPYGDGRKPFDPSRPKLKPPTGGN